MTRNLIPLQVSTKAVSYLYTRLSDMSISLMLQFSMKRMSSYLDSLWIKQVFPSLVSCKKWKKEFRKWETFVYFSTQEHLQEVTS